MTNIYFSGETDNISQQVNVFVKFEGVVKLNHARVKVRECCAEAGWILRDYLNKVKDYSSF